MPTVMGNIAARDKDALLNLITLITGDDANNILSGSLNAHKHGNVVTITYTHFEREQYITNSTKTDKSVDVQVIV